MAPAPKKPAVTADVILLQSLKSCLVNLPSNLVAALTNANTYAQNVVVELNFRQNVRSAQDSDKPTSIPRSVFVGWTGMQSKHKPASVLSARGMAAPRDRDIPTVEVDATFAQVIGLAEGTKVAVFLHVDPPQAHTINIEPLTAADWEMIELHAQFLELNFLSQIRAVPNPAYTTAEEPKQPPHAITLHLSPTSTANVKVTSIAPSPVGNSAFVKISPDAEVIVAPKTRKTERSSNRENRSVASAGRKSTRSATSTVRRKSSEGSSSKKAIFLRAVPRSLGEEWFWEEDPEMADKGLKVWVDRDVLLSKSFRGATYAAVSVVNPTGLLEPVDPQRAAEEQEKPATKIVAKIGRWDDAPDSQHIALSSLVSQALGIQNVVGGLIRLDVAPVQVHKRPVDSSKSKDAMTVKTLKIYPFSGTSLSQNSGFRFGGESKQEREESTKKLKAILGKWPEGNGLLDGPLTDGMVLPESGELDHAWQGGIVRFEPSQPDAGSRAGPNWVNAGERPIPIEIQPEIVKPTTTLRSWVPGEALPLVRPKLTGIDTTIDQLFAHLSHSSSVLLTGGIGAGKTNLAQYVAHRLRTEYLFNTIYFPCRTLVNDEMRVSTIKDTLNRVFGCAAWGARSGGHSIVVLDDLDRLCPAETELQVGGENGRSRHISECLVSVARQYCSTDSNVVLLAISSTKEAVNNVIIGGHVVREILNLSAPNKEGRRRVLEMLVHPEAQTPPTKAIEPATSEAVPAHGPSSALADAPGFSVDPTIDFLELAGQTDGYMPGDLVLLASRARSECLIRTVTTAPEDTFGRRLSRGSSIDAQPMLTKDDFGAALKGFTPASLRNVTLQTSTVKWDSIGGLRNTRQTLLETLQYPTTYAPIFAACPLRLRSGLLLYGFPGCGKTLLASAVASECGLNFISVKGPEILNKYIGASEQSVRDLFERASAARPCVLFFDEFDAIAPKRGHDSTGVTDRVVNQLLTQMDGAEGLSGVYVLAATSRPDLIDPALLRPGRLDKALLCDMPDLQDRADILRAVSSKVRVARDVQDRWDEVAAHTEGLSGADLQALVYNAQLEAVHDVLGDHDVPTDKAGNRKTNGINGAAVSNKTPRGLPEFSHFLFGEDDRALDFDEEVGPKALKERALIAQKIRDMQAVRRRQKAAARNDETALAEVEKNRRAHSDDGSVARENGDAAGEEEESGSKEPLIQWRHIEISLRGTRSSISPDDRRRLTRIYSEFVDGRSGDLPNGQGGTEIGGRTTLM